MMQGYIAVPRYFNAKRRVAMAIPSCGEAFGGVVFPLIINQLNEIYGWRDMFLMLSGIALQVCVCGALFRPLKTATSKSNEQNIKHDWSFLKMLNFQIVFTSTALFGFGASIVYGHLGAYANFELNITLTRTAALYSSISASIILFKLVFGILVDYENKYCMFEPFKLCIIFIFVGGMTTLTLSWITDFTGLVAFSVVFGASFASIGGALTPSILIRLYGGKGLDQLGLTYGVTMIYLGVGYVLGSPAAGNVLSSFWLLQNYDNTQSDIYIECVFILI